MHLIIGVPAYKRTNLLFVHTYYTHKYLKSLLEEAGFKVDYIVVGSSEEERSAVQYFDLEYHEMENVLSHKKNYIHNEAKKRGADYLFWLDSDDFIPSSLLLKTIEVANENTWWSSVTNMFIYDSFHKQMVHFNGYLTSHGLKDQGLGTCRIYTKRLLDKLPTDVFGYNKMSGMDGQIAPFLRKAPVAPRKRLITTPAHETLFGIKTSQNIWHLSDFQSQRLSHVDFDFQHTTFNWLDPEVREMILAIDPFNP